MPETGTPAATGAVMTKRRPADAATERAQRRAPQKAPPLPRARRVLLLVDVINSFDFDGAERLAAQVRPVLPVIAALKAALHRERVPAVYVNDNFGHWTADFRQLVARCRTAGGDAAATVRALAPAPGDLTVLKPRHSAFYATPLQLLLTQMGTRELVIAGFATDACVQLTAADAYQRGFSLWVPSDACAAQDGARHEAALQWLRQSARARTTAAGSVRGLPKRGEP
jgi:nicotinamidase-related amidase